jgi:hypothetical protein
MLQGQSTFTLSNAIQSMRLSRWSLFGARQRKAGGTDLDEDNCASCFFPNYQQMPSAK